MNSSDLIRESVKRIVANKVIVLIVGALFAALLFMYGRHKKTVYTSMATVFPLTTPSDNALSASALSGILGLTDAPKSFSSEASINIIELTMSRNVREAVAMTKLAQFGNKTIAELLIDEDNGNKFFFSKKLPVPADTATLAIVGGELLKPLLEAKMSKNGVLQINFSNTNIKYITPVSYAIIDKISQFYIDLKRKKALQDYNFTLIKIDSFQNVINAIEHKAVNIQNTNLFTPSKLQYQIPQNDVMDEKNRLTRQRDNTVNNKEDALWRLQKVTPIIEVLDKPTEPFDKKKTSTILLTILGFLLGVIFAGIGVNTRLYLSFISGQIKKSIMGDVAPTANS